MGGTANLLYSINIVYNPESIDQLTSLRFQLGYGKVTQQAFIDIIPSKSILLFKEIAGVISKSPEKYDLGKQLSEYFYDNTGLNWIPKEMEFVDGVYQLTNLVKAVVDIIFTKKLSNEVIDSPIEKKMLSLLNNTINYKLKVNLNNELINDLYKENPDFAKFTNEESLNLILTNLSWIIEHNTYVNNINVENCPLDYIYKSKKGKKNQNQSKRLGNLKCKKHCKSKNLYHGDFSRCVKRKHLFNCPLGKENNTSKCKSWCKSKNLLGDDLTNCISRTNNIVCDPSKNRTLCPEYCKIRGLIGGPKASDQYDNCVKGKSRKIVLSSEANLSRQKLFISPTNKSKRLPTKRKSPKRNRRTQ